VWYNVGEDSSTRRPGGFGGGQPTLGEEVDMSTAVDIAAIATPIVIGVGFYFAWAQWRSLRKSRMAEVVLMMSNRWDSPEMAASRQGVTSSGEDLRTEYESALKARQLEAFTTLTAVGDFFDTLGVLCCEGYLKCKIAYDLFGAVEEYYWNLYKPILESTEHKDYLPYFTRLHELFVKEEAARCRIKKPSTI
jgi:hypothetical protein